jgi:hypothetical protein
LWARKWTFGFFKSRGTFGRMNTCINFLKKTLHYCVQTGSGVNPAWYPMGSGGKAAEAWSWPLPSGAEVKNARSYISTPPKRFHSVMLN